MMASGLLSPVQVEDVFLNMVKLTALSVTVLEHCSQSDPVNAIIAMGLDQVRQPS